MITGAETLAFSTDPEARRAPVSAWAPLESGELGVYQPRQGRLPAVG